MPKITLNEAEIIQCIDAVHNLDGRSCVLHHTRTRDEGSIFSADITDTPAADKAIRKVDAAPGVE